MEFHLPCCIRQAAVTLEQIQLLEIEEVLVAGASPAGREQPLLDETSNARRGAVAEVLGSLGDR